METKSQKMKLHLEYAINTEEEWVERTVDRVSVPPSDSSVPTTPYSEYDNWPGPFHQNFGKESGSLGVPVMVPPSSSSITKIPPGEMCLDATYPVQSALFPKGSANKVPEPPYDHALNKDQGCCYCWKECCSVCWDNCCNVFCSGIGLACSTI